jgi:hypothetical protein
VSEERVITLCDLGRLYRRELRNSRFLVGRKDFMGQMDYEESIETDLDNRRRSLEARYTMGAIGGAARGESHASDC